jgi:hypothetical protein
MIMALAVLNMKVSFNDMDGSGVGLDALQKVYAQTPEDGGSNAEGSGSWWDDIKESVMEWCDKVVEYYTSPPSTSGNVTYEKRDSKTWSDRDSTWTTTYTVNEHGDTTWSHTQTVTHSSGDTTTTKSHGLFWDIGY